MSLIVEDGTGLLDSESYVSVAFADDYFDKRGGSLWFQLSLNEKEINLRKGTEYIDRRFTYYAIRYRSTQALEWPRYPYWRTGQPIPVEVKRACCEYAIRSAGAPLTPDPVQDPTRLPVIETMTEIGGAVKEQIKYQPGAFTPAMFASYPEADSLLLRFVAANTLERS